MTTTTMRADLSVTDRHPAGYRWAQKLEEETGIHNLVGLSWNIWDEGGHPLVSGCDTAWMLAHVCPRTWQAARSLVLRAIAGLKTRPGVTLVSPVKDYERERAIEISEIN